MKKSELKEMIIDILSEIADKVDIISAEDADEEELEEDRDYKAEYQNYHSKPDQKKNRAKRNNARRRFEREGRVSKGDGNDVDHKNPIRSGGGNDDTNLRVRTVKSNRSDNGQGK